MSRTNDWVDGPPETDGRAYPAGVLLRVRLGDGESGIFLVGHINEVAGEVWNKDELALWLGAEIRMQAEYSSTGDLDDFYVDGHLDLEDLAEKIIKLRDDCTDGWSREDIIAHKVIWDGR